MDRVPSTLGWRTVRFDQIADNIAERVEPAEADTDIYVGLEHLDPDSLRLRRWGTPADVEGTKLRFYPGDVIFGRRRAYQRKLAVAEVEGICSAHAMVLRAKPDVCLPEFLPFFLQSDRFFERAMAISVGSLSPTINWKTLAVQEFPLPPLDEQRRIAEILWAAEELVWALQDLMTACSSTQSRLVEQVMIAGIDDSGQLRDPRCFPELFHETSVGLLPKSWDLHPLISFAPEGKGTFVNGPFGSDLLTNELQSEGVPVIYVRDVKPGRYLRISTAHVSLRKADQLSFCDVRKGDVLIAKVGDPPCDAAPYLDDQQAIVTQDVIRIRPNKDVDSRFLSALLNSPMGRRQVRAISGGGTRKRVSLTEFKQLVLPKPPFGEQTRIAALLNRGDLALLSVEKHLTQAKHLREQLAQRFTENSF